MDIKPPNSAQTRRLAASKMSPSQQQALARQRRKPRLSTVWKIVAGVTAVALLVAAGLIALELTSPIDKDKYQAVFLTNGQVYFGKLDGWSTGRPTLTNVYYFQSNSDQPNQADNTQTLIKLGDEIHKPADKLIFNREAILFVENLEDGGKVAEAISRNHN